jgi:hypothetical protein
VQDGVSGEISSVMMDWECSGIGGILGEIFGWTWQSFGGDLEYAHNFVTWN